jgi:hypothetical protein
LRSQHTAIEKLTSPMRLANQSCRSVVRGKSRLPITSIDHRLAPSETRLWTLRLSRQPFEAIDTLQAKNSLTQPAFVIALPIQAPAAPIRREE